MKITGKMGCFLLCFFTGFKALGLTELYVSPLGNDHWTGRLPAANTAATDGPLASLERARDLLREQRGDAARTNGVVVWLRGGDYFSKRSFALGVADGGTQVAPVSYAAYLDEPARLVGGQAVSQWEPVGDPVILNRLAQSARGHVLQADLRSLGIADSGRLKRRGFGASGSPPPLELFSDDRPMTLARWPNDRWLNITGVPAGQQGGKFSYSGENPAHWQTNDDLWVYGYWTYDWAESFEKVVNLELPQRVVQTAPPHGVYGYTAGKRFFFLNILEELDQPGEYYVEPKAGKIYWWPPAQSANPLSPAALVSVLTEPLVALKNASFVTIRGLTLEAGRGNALAIEGGTGCRVAGCTIRNVGQYAVTISGGATNCGVVGCEITETGSGGIALDGGDRRTLTPGNLYAINNHIHHTGRLLRTYNPAVSLNGVGNRVANNRIHDLPHTAISGGGNDHLVEYNEIFRVCLETGDAGAFYMGRDFTQRGNVIRYNHFHDLRAGALAGQGGFTEVMAVYLDDCFSGTTVFGNLFVRAGRSAMIGGGRDNTIENNIFIDGSPAIHVDSRGQGWASFWFNGKDDTLMEGLKRMAYDRPPYSVHYPGLTNILNDQPMLAKGNRILRNISVGGKWRELSDGLSDKTVLFEDNLITNDPGFVAASQGDYRLKAESPASRLGFKPIPFEKIGLYRDEFRKTIPHD